jgi:ABC-type bacteriocin/lantibiotic exporter with double-glycine peptidase domain
VRLPTVRQATDYTCGVAALQSVLRYYGLEIREDRLAAILKSDPDKGTSYLAIESFARENGFATSIRRDMTLEELKDILRGGSPVLCAIQAWPEMAVDWKTDWNDGHWVVAIGFEESRMFFMDPSSMGNYTYIPDGEFLDRWHDTDSDCVTELNHFGIVISKPVPNYDPDEILRLE